MVNLWLREQDVGLLGKGVETPVSVYRKGLVQGHLDNPGFLGGLGKHFVLGKEGVWIPKGTNHKYHFARIDNSLAYSNGIFLTPYSRIDVIYHLGSRPIDKKTPLESEELLGSDQDDFVERVFRTYYGPTVRRIDERGQHFLLYSTYDKRPLTA